MTTPGAFDRPVRRQSYMAFLQIKDPLILGRFQRRPVQSITGGDAEEPVAGIADYIGCLSYLVRLSNCSI
jgi:hypothetical protein